VIIKGQSVEKTVEFRLAEAVQVYITGPAYGVDLQGQHVSSSTESSSLLVGGCAR
jgi:hypothetical protein